MLLRTASSVSPAFYGSEMEAQVQGLTSPCPGRSRVRTLCQALSSLLPNSLGCTPSILLIQR